MNDQPQKTNKDLMFYLLVISLILFVVYMAFQSWSSADEKNLTKINQTNITISIKRISINNSNISLFNVSFPNTTRTTRGEMKR